jgi:DNA-binding NtrC family response regulator
MRTYTILLVDDEPNVTASLARQLHQEPFRVLRADSAREAIEILKNERIDVVISDQQMPAVSGTEFFAHLQRIHPDVVRMILTGHATLDTALEAINEGHIYRFFVKPADPSAIGYAVREALQQRMLQEENEALQERVEQQDRILERLEKHIPGITQMEFDDEEVLTVEGSRGD